MLRAIALGTYIHVFVIALNSFLNEVLWSKYNFFNFNFFLLSTKNTFNYKKRQIKEIFGMMNE